MLLGFKVAAPDRAAVEVLVLPRDRLAVQGRSRLFAPEEPLKPGLYMRLTHGRVRSSTKQHSGLVADLVLRLAAVHMPVDTRHGDPAAKHADAGLRLALQGPIQRHSALLLALRPTQQHQAYCMLVVAGIPGLGRDTGAVN